MHQRLDRIAIIGGLTGVGMLLGLGTGLLLAGSASEPAADERQILADLAPLDDEADLDDEAYLDETSLDDLVADAQRMLSLGGYDPGPIDGQLGLRTQRAIRSYHEAVRTGGLLDALKKGEPEPGAALDSARYDVEARPTPTSIVGD